MNQAIEIFLKMDEDTRRLLDRTKQRMMQDDNYHPSPGSEEAQLLLDHIGEEFIVGMVDEEEKFKRDWIEG